MEIRAADRAYDDRNACLTPHELETRIAKKVTKAITEYGLIEDGDRIMVGLSGGKDSWALMQILDVLQQARADRLLARRGEHRLGLRGLRAPQADRDVRGARLGAARRAHQHRRDDRGHPRGERDAVLALRAAAPRRALPPGDTGRRHQDRARPPRRRFHRDAAAEPVLPARSRRCRRASSPTTASTSSSVRSSTSSSPRRARTRRRRELPIIGCCCPACGDLSLQRQRIKRLIARARGRASGHQELDAALDRQRRSRGTCSTERLNPLDRQAAPQADGAAVRCRLAPRSICSA